MSQLKKIFHRYKRLTPLFLLILATFFVSLIHYNYGWIPHDEGLLHGCAERIKNGELPHIDFYAGYTGFIFYYINFLHNLFGNNILSARYPLIILNVGIIVLVYFIVKRFSDNFAFLAGLLCLAWGMNNYFAPLPSWYCLFFGLLSLYILIAHYQKKRRARYLFLSGLVIGFSFLFKQSIGIYNLLAFLTYLCLEYLPADHNKNKLTHFLTASCYLFIIFVLIFIINLTINTEPLWFTLFLSLSFISFAFITIKINKKEQNAADMNYIFIKKFAAATAGFASACLPFLSIFSAKGELIGFFKSFFTIKSIYSRFISVPVYTDISDVTLGFLILLLWLKFIKTFFKIPAAALIILLIYPLFYGEIKIFKMLWDLLTLIPLFSIFCSAIMMPKLRVVNKTQSSFLLLTLFSFFFYLIIIPYGYSLYYIYFIPFSIILLLYSVSINKNIALFNIKIVKIILVIFIISGIYFNEKYRILIGGVAKRPAMKTGYELLDLPRGQIYVPKNDSIVYKRLSDIINYYTKPGEFIFAYTECSEIYYIFQRNNPCWHVYADITKEIEPYEEILRKIIKKKVNLVIINGYAESYIPSEERKRFLEKLAELYPLKYDIGRFCVRIK